MPYTRRIAIADFAGRSSSQGLKEVVLNQKPASKGTGTTDDKTIDESEEADSTDAKLEI